MAATREERSAEETKRLARLAGAVYVSLGLATACAATIRSAARQK